MIKGFPNSHASQKYSCTFQKYSCALTSIKHPNLFANKKFTKFDPYAQYIVEISISLIYIILEKFMKCLKNKNITQNEFLCRWGRSVMDLIGKPQWMA